MSLVAVFLFSCRLVLSSSSWSCLILLFSSSMVLSFFPIMVLRVSPNFSCCTDLLSIWMKRSWPSRIFLLAASSCSRSWVICLRQVSSWVSCFDTLFWRLYNSFSALSFSSLAVSRSFSTSFNLLSVANSFWYSLFFSSVIFSISILSVSIFSSATSMSFSNLSISLCLFSSWFSNDLSLSVSSFTFFSSSAFFACSSSRRAPESLPNSSNCIYVDSRLETLLWTTSKSVWSSCLLCVSES